MTFTRVWRTLNRLTGGLHLTAALAQPGTGATLIGSSLLLLALVKA